MIKILKFPNEMSEIPQLGAGVTGNHTLMRANGW